jgi:type IV secretory pathway TraG/TraD family ATPase VirD4
MDRMNRRPEIAGGRVIRGTLALTFVAIATLDGLTMVDSPPPLILLGKLQILQGRTPAPWDLLLIAACLALAVFLAGTRIVRAGRPRSAAGLPWWQHVPVKVWWWAGRIATCAGILILGLRQLGDLLDGVRQGEIPQPSLAGYIPILVSAGLFMFFVLREPTPRLHGATTHGSAGWAEDRDIQPLLWDARSPLPPGGLLLGPYNRRANLVLPVEYADLHTLILGPTGSGKTRCYIMPNTGLSRASFVASDPKGELWATTSGWHREAWRFAPREPHASEAFNWIPLCRDEHLARLLAMAVMQTDEDSHEQHFWKYADLRMCAALFAHTAFQAVPTPSTAYRLLELPPTQLIDLLRTSPARLARVFANTIAEMKDETQAGVVMSVSDKLAFLDDPVVRRFTSASLTPPDFGQLLADPARPIAVYWVVHERDAALLQPLSSVFFTLLLEHLGRVRGHPDARAALFLDEFASIGRIPDFPTTIVVARGRGLQLVLGVQSLSQLEHRYGKAGADTIRNNCATKIVLHGVDETSGEQVSRALGEATIQQEVQTRTPQGWTSNAYSYAEQHVQRRLRTSDEVRRIDDDEALIIVSNLRPILAKRQRWAEPARQARAKPLGPEQGMDPPGQPLGVIRPPRPPKPGDELRFVREHLPELEDDSA